MDLACCRWIQAQRKGSRGRARPEEIWTLLAIDCMKAKDPESEDTTAKLVSYLCKKHGLDSAMMYTLTIIGCMDVYKIVAKRARKNCPLYILPHWNKFLDKSKEEYYNEKVGPETKPKTNALYTRASRSLLNINPMQMLFSID